MLQTACYALICLTVFWVSVEAGLSVYYDGLGIVVVSLFIWIVKVLCSSLLDGFCALWWVFAWGYVFAWCLVWILVVCFVLGYLIVLVERFLAVCLF